MTQRPSAAPPRGPSRRAGAGSDAPWSAALLLALWAVVGAAALAGEHFGYDKWDNFEYHTPTLLEAHGQWLDGRLPLWSPHQHMGEPLLASAQPSVFYWPYTAIVLVMRVVGAPPGAFCLWVVLLHLAWMGLGTYRLLRALTVRPTAAWLGSLGVSTCGALTATSSVWIFASPILAWLPWVLRGVVGLLHDDRVPAHLLLTALGLAMIGFVCHPQFLAYAWLLVGGFAVGGALFAVRRPRALIRVGGAGVAALLLSAPALLPVLGALPESGREPFAERVFLANAALPGALLGLLNPVSEVTRGFFFTHSAQLFAQGVWVLPALALALASLLAAPPRGRQPAALGSLPGWLAVLAVLGALFTSFALGGQGGLYPLTHGLPVWSSFRWPHKFSSVAVLAVGLAAAVALEIYLRRADRFPAPARLAFAASFLLAFGLPLLAAESAAARTPAGVVSLVAGGAGLSVLPWVDRREVRAVLLGSAWVSAAALGVLVHGVNLKTYREALGTVGAEAFGIEPGYRVLPLSMHRHAWQTDAPTSMQQHALFQMATANGYDSLTGFTTSLAPSWYREVVGSDGFGLLPRERTAAVLRSHWLGTVNVRYLVAARDEPELLDELGGIPSLRPHRVLSRVAVFENTRALPRAYFASETRPYSPEALEAGLFANGAPPRTAFAEGSDAVRPRPPARVVGMRAGGGPALALDVEAPEGGFLVIARTWYPQWKARVDGVPVAVVRTNGAVLGIEIPAGARRVELGWASGALRAGLALAGLGAALLAALTWRAAREGAPSRRQGGGPRASSPG